MKKTMTIGIFTIAGFMSAFNAVAQSNAKLIVYRKGSPYGLLAHYKVKVDDKEVATLKNNSVRTIDIAPGQHSIAPKQSKRAVQLNAEPGKTYVVKYRTMLGIFGARPRLKEMTKEEAMKDSRLVK